MRALSPSQREGCHIDGCSRAWLYASQPGARELFGLGKRRQRKRKPSTGKKAQSSATQPAASQPPAVKPGAVQGKCPLRGFAKPLGGLLAFSAKGHYKCPEAVIRMRAAVARLKPVRELRPQVSDFHTFVAHRQNIFQY